MKRHTWQKRWISAAAFSGVLLCACMASGQPVAGLPASWQVAWKKPGPQYRPLQIVHGIRLPRRQLESVEQAEGGSPLERAALAEMEKIRDHGLGGVVCNVDFQDYMTSDRNWTTLIEAIKACRELGLLVWLYDEQGYPSGAAGGLVLQENRSFEAMELAYDKEADRQFIVRPAYEYTHASNNYYAARRYINLIDERAVASFLDKTHEQYWKRLEPYFGNTIQATFTDEPSLIAINIGQIPEDARKRVTVVDPTDPNVKCLPRVPWSYDLAEQYQQRFGENLLPHRKSLFRGTAPEDRHVRRQFWSLIADLVADRYFGGLEHWCENHRVLSSGHSLWEENLLHQVPLEGNGLKALGRMHIPGLDMLSSDPMYVLANGWMTAALPASAARLGNRRRVMTEVSDFSQKMGGQGPVGLAKMQATAAWQAAWDVTDFTLYYGMGDRSIDDYRGYCDFVGRLNAVLRDATPQPEVLLYYPIYDLWAEYIPVAESLKVNSQSPGAQQIVASTMKLGRMLQRSQIPFTFVDHEHLARATVGRDGSLKIGTQRYRSLVVPQGVAFPQSAQATVDQFSQAGGRVLRDGLAGASLSLRRLSMTLQPATRITPSSERIVLGQFTRDKSTIVIAVNVGNRSYNGTISLSSKDDWLTLDPATGAVTQSATAENGNVSLTLEPLQTRLIVRTSTAK